MCAFFFVEERTMRYSNVCDIKILALFNLPFYAKTVHPQHIRNGVQTIVYQVIQSLTWL
jgi:hypothetical protein